MSRIACVLVAITAAVAALGAQAPSPADAPSFKAGIELIRLDVRVTGKDGLPFNDLKQDEFKVVVDGKPRPVVLFQHVVMPTAPLDEVTRRTVTAEVSTNQGAPRGHLYVLVFDQMHIAPGNEQRARQAAARFLKTRIHPGDQVAAYALPGPGPAIGFTGDARRIAAALTDVRGMAQAAGATTMSLPEAYAIRRGDQVVLQEVANREQAQLSATDSTPTGLGGTGAISGGTTTTNQFIQEDARRMAAQADEQTRRTLLMLGDVLRPMSTIEGRKTILFISEGFNADELEREIDDLAAAAAESYSVIDAIDINRRDLDMKADLPTGSTRSSGIHDQLSSLATLSLQTSGEVAIDANDHMGDVFGRIGAEEEDYYLVGFAPPEGLSGTRGAYHQVSVKVDRPNAHVSARTGFALDKASARLGRHDAIDRALTAPFAQQSLPLRYTTYVMKGSGGGVERVFLSLSADLPVASADDKRPADVVFVVRATGDGHVAASGTDTIALPAAPAEGSTTGVGDYHVQFEIAPGDYLMRAVVRTQGGLVGSADRKFTVRALDGPALTSSDVVVGASHDQLPVRATAFTLDGLGGVLDLYGRSADQVDDAQVVVDVIPVGETSPVVSGFADLQAVRTTTGGVERPAHFALPLTGVAPGRYVLRATTKNGGETAAQVDRELDVVAGAAPAATAAATTTAPAIEPHDLVTAAFAGQYVDRLANTAQLADAKRALDRLGAKDYPSAIAGLTSVLNAEDHDRHWVAAATAFYLGWAYHFAGQDREAISAWRRAAYLDPTIVPVHLALADLYVRLSQPALAVQALQAGLTALPQSPALLDRLSRIERR